MILPIYTYNNKILNSTGERIESINDDIKELISNMFETMKQANGIGLAAQQIGKNLKLFIIDIDHHEGKMKSKVFINSEIIEYGEQKTKFEEGCLSFPGIHVNVERSQKIKVKYFDENFVEHEEDLSGIAAICFQHEHDHTEGITFLKRLKPIQKKMIETKLKGIIKKDFVKTYKVK